MRYRRLGHAGLQVSEVALGSWLTFGKLITDDTAEALMKLGAMVPASVLLTQAPASFPAGLLSPGGPPANDVEVTDFPCAEGGFDAA